MICVNKKCSELIEGLAVTVCVVALFFFMSQYWGCGGITNQKSKTSSESKVHCGSALRFGRDSADYLRTAHHAYAFLL